MTDSPVQNPRILTNAGKKEVSLFSPRDKPHATGWWMETSFLTHTLTDNDQLTFEAALEKAVNGNDAVLVSALGTVANELHARLVHLGYMVPGPGSVPSEMVDFQEAYALTDYGTAKLPEFLAKQRLQWQIFNGDPAPVEDFAGTFNGMTVHHRGLSTEALIYFREFFASVENTIEVEPRSPRESLLGVYETLGVVESRGGSVWATTEIGSMNAPFLLDILLSERGNSQASAAVLKKENG